MGFVSVKQISNRTPLFVLLVSLILINLDGQGILIASVEVDDGKVSTSTCLMSSIPLQKPGFSQQKSGDW